MACQLRQRGLIQPCSALVCRWDQQCVRTGGQDRVSSTRTASTVPQLHRARQRPPRESSAGPWGGWTWKEQAQPRYQQSLQVPTRTFADPDCRPSSHCPGMAASCWSAATETHVGLEVNLSFPRLSNISEGAASCVSGPFCGKSHTWRQSSA